MRALPFVLASTDTGTMILNHKDRHDTPAGSYGVGYQYLQTGAFDPSEVKTACDILALKRQINGDGVFALDCGANIGAHTIAWAKSMAQWGGCRPLRRKRGFTMRFVGISL